MIYETFCTPNARPEWTNKCPVRFKLSVDGECEYRSDMASIGRSIIFKCKSNVYNICLLKPYSKFTTGFKWMSIKYFAYNLGNIFSIKYISYLKFEMYLHIHSYVGNHINHNSNIELIRNHN